VPVGFGHYRKYTIDTAVFDRMEPAAAWVLGLWLGNGSVVYTFTVYSRAAREFGKYLYADSTEATRGARKHAIWEAGCVPCP